jgi:hypothetical protein
MPGDVYLTDPSSAGPPARRWAGAILAAAVSACSAILAPAASAMDAPAASAVDPGAVRALDRMGAYLRSLKAFEVRIDTRIEQNVGGKPQGLGFTTRYRIQRPDRLYAELTSQGRTMKFYFRGGDLTVFSPDTNKYARESAPPTLKQSMDLLYARHGFRIPVTRLMYFDSKAGRPSGLRSARKAGPGGVDGILCDTYAFSQGGLDWQVWIRRGLEPVPLQLVVSDPRDPARSRYVARLDWTLFPAILQREFVFNAPPGAQRVDALG